MNTVVDIELTVQWPTKRAEAVDVRLRVPTGATIAQALPALAAAMGAHPWHMSVRGEEVTPDSVIGLPPLVHGATLVWDEPASTHTRTDTSTAPIDIVVVAGPDAGKRCPLSPSGVVIGRTQHADLAVEDPRLSRAHVRITPSDNGFRITDLGSTNGTRCGDIDLDPGQGVDTDGSELITIGDTRLRLTRVGVVRAPTRARGDGRIDVNRSPRPTPPRTTQTVTGPKAPTPPRRGRIPWIAAVIPVPFAGLLAYFFGPQMLAFALLSPLMLIGNVLGDRWGSRREHRREQAAYETVLTQRTAGFDTLTRLEREQRWRELPDPAATLEIATAPTTRIWERRRSSEDFGRVRVGVATLPSRTAWCTEPGDAPAHPDLAGVPVDVNLDAAGGLGVAGAQAEVTAVTDHVLGHIVATHSPRDVRLIVHTGQMPHTPGPPLMTWTRRLPHTLVYGDLDQCLDAVREVIARHEDDELSDTRSGVRTIVVMPWVSIESDLGEFLDVMERAHAAGVWSIVGAEQSSSLPATCHAVLSLADGRARLDVDGATPVVDIVPDRVSWWWSERLGRALAPLRDPGADADVLPSQIDLLDLLEFASPAENAPHPRAALTADTIRERWGVGDGPIARVGHVGGGTWDINLASDGPHLLVGGTTGSGKSEFLRALVTSLALQCSPADMNFVLVDYKGGSAFGECADLPHTVGMVTNLDDGLAHRALTSLQAEITRREHVIAGAGARDYTDYHHRASDRTELPALPRLVIVIDEFRLLAEELPEFVDGMVALAAVGRSLGVHLVLATQRPAGAITADIQANVNLRIAMRVRDQADSRDVIDSPLAARIRSDVPGRGLARTGDGDLVEFQGAYVGAGRSRVDITVSVLDRLGRIRGPAFSAVPDDGPTPTGERPTTESTGLAAIATATHAAYDLIGAADLHRPWLPPLPHHITTGQTDICPTTMTVSNAAFALIDRPAQQRQDELAHATTTGHLLIVGGPRSGRSTALRSILASHLCVADAPTHAYVIATTEEHDGLCALPQVGAVVHPEDSSRIRRLIATLEGVQVPTVLIIDGWDRLEADTHDTFDGVRDQLTALLRAGNPHLRAVITGDRSVLSNRIGAVVSESILLPFADPAHAMYAGLSPRELPSEQVPGRGMRLSDRAELQIAVRDPLHEVGVWDPTWPLPQRVAQLPAVVEWNDLPRSIPASPDLLPFGASADEGGVAVLDLAHYGRRILVAGQPRSGRSTALAALGRAALAAGSPVAVVHEQGGSLAHALPEALRVDPWDGEALIAARRERPDLVVLIDDADHLTSTPIEPVLAEISALVARDSGLVVAATTPEAASSAFRGSLHTIASSRSGLLLSPRRAGEGEPFGISAPVGGVRVPGRALLVRGASHQEVQIARVARDAPCARTAC